MLVWDSLGVSVTRYGKKKSPKVCEHSPKGFEREDIVGYFSVAPSKRKYDRNFESWSLLAKKKETNLTQLLIKKCLWLLDNYMLGD